MLMSCLLVPSHFCLYLQYISDRSVANPLQVFQVGQSVKARVVEVDQAKNRFLLSLTMSDCCHGDVDESIDVLDAYLGDCDVITQRFKLKKGVIFLSRIICHCIYQVC